MPETRIAQKDVKGLEGPGIFLLLNGIPDGLHKGFHRGDSIHALKKRKLRMPAQGIRKQPRLIMFIEQIEFGMLVAWFLGIHYKAGDHQ